MKNQSKNRKSNYTKKNREFILTISMYLLNQEVLKSLFWNVKSVDYRAQEREMNIGISTTNGKLGTTLSKLRKTARGLSDYLYEQGLTFRPTQIQFYIDKHDEEIVRMNSMLEEIEQKQPAYSSSQSE